MLERLPPPISSFKTLSTLPVIASLFLASAGCAVLDTPKPNHLLEDSSQSRWEDEPAPRKRKPYHKRSVEKKPRTLRELVEGFGSADNCFLRAKTNSAQNLEASWALARACVQYRGFDKLEDVLDKPWTPIIQKKWPDLAPLVVRVSALAGGRVEFDVGLCNKFGLEVTHLRATFADLEGAKGELVMFRATALRSWVHAKKTRVLLRYEGREIHASAKLPPDRFRQGSEYVVIGRLKGLLQSPNAPEGSVKLSITHAEPVRTK